MIQKNRYFTLFAAVAVLESCCCEIMPIMVPAVRLGLSQTLEPLVGLTLAPPLSVEWVVISIET